MSTCLEEPPSARSQTGQRLRAIMAGVRVSISWFGVRKSLTREQKSQAAESFGAESDCVSAAKKILDTRHPAFKTVSSVRGRVVALWRSMSLAYPEPGVRLIRQDDIQDFEGRMTALCADLEEAVAALDEQYVELRSAARLRLGSLYNSLDYPDSLRGLFSVEWDYPSFEPPSYLRQLSPELYQQECARIQGRFDEAVRLAEEAFSSELAKLVSHLTERLTGLEDGKPKIFRDSAVENLTQFFERFRHLNVRSSVELDQLVSQCQEAVRGIDPQKLRDSRSLRAAVATDLVEVQVALDQFLIDRPRRNLIRRAR